jgi:hypothetical protein
MPGYFMRSQTIFADYMRIHPLGQGAWSDEIGMQGKQSEL